MIYFQRSSFQIFPASLIRMRDLEDLILFKIQIVQLCLNLAGPCVYPLLSGLKPKGVNANHMGQPIGLGPFNQTNQTQPAKTHQIQHGGSNHLENLGLTVLGDG